jgi:tryptophan synthase alpha chain
MTENRIIERFRHNQQANAHGLLPYLTAGYPDPRTCAALIATADALGATVVEVGFPYSDSIADGPVIQSSFHAALAQGHRVRDTFEIVRSVRGRVRCGLVAMVSYTIAHRLGLDPFMDEAVEAGFDGVILPDVPVEESAEMRDAAQSRGLCYIGLVAPTTTPARRERIARESSGFIYQIAAAGTTGEREGLAPELPDEVKALRRVSGLPVCVGFGISTAEHVREVCRFADGAIVGSAIVRRIEQAIGEGLSSARVVQRVEEFLGGLMLGLGPCG